MYRRILSFCLWFFFFLFFRFRFSTLDYLQFLNRSSVLILSDFLFRSCLFLCLLGFSFLLLFFGLLDSFFCFCSLSLFFPCSCLFFFCFFSDCFLCLFLFFFGTFDISIFFRYRFSYRSPSCSGDRFSCRCFFCRRCICFSRLNSFRLFWQL